MERITSWLFSSGGAWTSLEAYPDGSEAGTGWSSSTMVAVAPDLREFCVSAVEQMAIDNKLLANSDELTINEAAYIYEQFIAGLWNSPLAQSDPDMWTRALKYAERAAAVAALHYLEQRLSTQHEHKLAGRQECDCYRTDTQRQRQQIQPTHTEVQTVDLAGDQARAVRHDEAECLAVMHKTVTSERTAAARMRNALGGLRQQGAPPVSDWAAPKDRERWTYEVQENLRTAAPVSQTNAMDGKVATMEDIARLLNETLDELDAQYAILGGGALNDDSSMLSSALVSCDLLPLCFATSCILYAVNANTGLLSFERDAVKVVRQNP